MGYCSAKNKAITENRANISTERYKRKDVNFEEVLKSSVEGNLKASRAGHITSSPSIQKFTPTTVEDRSGLENNVDIEQEMADLAKNTLNFKFASKRISGHFKTLETIIKSGGS